MTIYNWGIIGTGWIAGEMAQTLTDEKGEIYGVTTKRPEELEQFAKQYPVKHQFTSVADLLADEAVDIVYVATPHHLHAKLIRQALEAGKHVVSEKAITINSDELMSLVELARQKNLILMEAMTVLHMPIWQYLTKAVDDGLIGNVKMIQINFGSHKVYDVTNRFFNPELAGGALLDIGGYALSVARLFMRSQPNQLLTTVNYFETGVDEESVIVLKNKDGQMASITLTMQAKQPKRALISGDKGYIEVYDYPRGDKAVVVETATGEKTEIIKGESAKALAYEVADFERFVDNKDSDGALAYTIDVMNLMTAIRKEWGFYYPSEKE